MLQRGPFTDGRSVYVPTRPKPPDKARKKAPVPDKEAAPAPQPARRLLGALPATAVVTTCPPREPRAETPLGEAVSHMSARLASINASVDSITDGIKARHGPLASRPLLSLPTDALRVARLESRYPAPIHLFSDRCEYNFRHPYENAKIRMVMIFRDFREAVLRRRRRELAFRVARPLEHFGRDYDPADPRHYIAVQLPTDVAVRQLLDHLRAQVSVRLVP